MKTNVTLTFLFVGTLLFSLCMVFSKHLYGENCNGRTTSGPMKSCPTIPVEATCEYLNSANSGCSGRIGTYQILAVQFTQYPSTCIQGVANIQHCVPKKIFCSYNHYCDSGGANGKCKKGSYVLEPDPDWVPPIPQTNPPQVAPLVVSGQKLIYAAAPSCDLPL